MSNDLLSGHKGWSLTYKTAPSMQVEARKYFDKGQGHILLIVATDKGYTHRGYGPSGGWRPTKGVNVHLSTNGPLMMTFEEFDEIAEVVEDAKKFLRIS